MKKKLFVLIPVALVVAFGLIVFGGLLLLDLCFDTGTYLVSDRGIHFFVTEEGDLWHMNGKEGTFDKLESGDKVLLIRGTAIAESDPAQCYARLCFDIGRGEDYKKVPHDRWSYYSAMGYRFKGITPLYVTAGDEGADYPALAPGEVPTEEELALLESLFGMDLSDIDWEEDYMLDEAFVLFTVDGTPLVIGDRAGACLLVEKTELPEGLVSGDRLLLLRRQPVGVTFPGQVSVKAFAELPGGGMEQLPWETVEALEELGYQFDLPNLEIVVGPAPQPSGDLKVPELDVAEALFNVDLSDVDWEAYMLEAGNILFDQNGTPVYVMDDGSFALVKNLGDAKMFQSLTNGDRVAVLRVIGIDESYPGVCYIRYCAKLEDDSLACIPEDTLRALDSLGHSFEVETTDCQFEFEGCEEEYHPFAEYEHLFGTSLTDVDPQNHTVEIGYVFIDDAGNYFFLSEDEDYYRSSGYNNYFLVVNDPVAKTYEMLKGLQLSSGDRVAVLRELAVRESFPPQGKLTLCVKLSDLGIGSIPGKLLQGLSGFGHKFTIDPMSIADDLSLVTYLNMHSGDLPIGLMTRIDPKREAYDEGTPYALILRDRHGIFWDGIDGESGSYEADLTAQATRWPTPLSERFYVTELCSESKYTSVFNCSYESDAAWIRERFEANGFAVKESGDTVTCTRYGVSVVFVKHQSVTLSLAFELPRGGVLDGTLDAETVFGDGISGTDWGEYTLDEGYFISSTSGHCFLYHDDGSLTYLTADVGSDRDIFAALETGDRIAVIRRLEREQGTVMRGYIKQVAVLGHENLLDLPQVLRAVVELERLGYSFYLPYWASFEQIDSFFSADLSSVNEQEYHPEFGHVLFTADDEAIFLPFFGGEAAFVMDCDPALLAGLKNGDCIAVLRKNGYSYGKKHPVLRVQFPEKLYDGSLTYIPLPTFKSLVEMGYRFSQELMLHYGLTIEHEEKETTPPDPAFITPSPTVEDQEAAAVLNAALVTEGVPGLLDKTRPEWLEDVSAELLANGCYCYCMESIVSVDREDGTWEELRYFYTVTASPKQNGYYITEIKCTGAPDRLLGCSYLSSLADIRAAFEPLGYAVTQQDGTTITAAKGGITVTFRNDGSLTLSAR